MMLIYNKTCYSVVKQKDDTKGHSSSTPPVIA